MKEDMIDKSQELIGEIIGQDHKPLKEGVTQREEEANHPKESSTP